MDYWNPQHLGNRVVVFDALTYGGNNSSLDGAPHTELVEGDIRDSALVERLIGVPSLRKVLARCTSG